MMEKDKPRFVDHEGRKVVIKKPVEWIRTNEEKILSQLDHPRIPKFIMRQGEEIYIEFMSGQDLYALLEERKFEPLPKREAIKIVYQVAVLCVYVHSKGIAHLDIKPENVVIDDSEVKLIDFGLSFDTKVESKKRYSGSLEYTSPEILLKYLEYDPFLSDVYSLGVLLHVLLTSQQPFTVNERTISLLAYRRDPDFDWNIYYNDKKIVIDAEIQKLIEVMMSSDPIKRPEMIDVRDILGNIIAGYENASPNPYYERYIAPSLNSKREKVEVEDPLHKLFE